LLLSTARLSVSVQDLEAMRHEVDALVGSIVDHMAPDARDRARERALDQLVRERFHLPTITLS
jgi:hypothetical protein